MKKIIGVAVLFTLCALNFYSQTLAAVSGKVKSGEGKTASKISSEEKKFRKNAVLDEILNVQYVTVSDYNLKRGAVQVSLSDGSFNVSAEDRNGGLTSVFSRMSSSPVVLIAKVDKTVYDLNKSSAVKKQVRKTLDGAQITYIVKNLVQITLDFNLFASQEGSEIDSVKIFVHSSNVSDKKHSVAVRLLLDTVLGENTTSHFYGVRGFRINSEYRFSKQEVPYIRYILSTDEDTSVQVMVSGEGISPLETVTVANPDFLRRLGWDDPVTKKRSFNSANSYNNSAIMLEWPAAELEPKQNVTNDFYLFTATDGAKCKGILYIDGEDEPEDNSYTPEVLIPPVKEKPEPPAAKPVKKVEKTDKSKFPPKLSAAKDKKPKEDFVVPPVREYQLDPQYIQNLIDKIDSLQSDSKNVNKAEVDRLNAELDAIFNTLRQQ